MADLAVVKRNVSPLPGSTVRNMIASGAGSTGDVVAIANDFGAVQADGDNANAKLAVGVGIVSAVNCEGATDFVAGDAISVVVHGPVSGFVATAPGTLFVSDTAGKVADAAGTNKVPIGRVETADVIFVNPSAAILS